MTAAASPLRVVIVDDEHIARQRVRRLLDREGGCVIVAECATGVEAIAAVEKYNPDLLLLDVQMPELDGFGVVAQLSPENTPLVIFVTAHDTHALRAFDVHAVDYVLKPIKADRLRVALDRARLQQGRSEAVERHEQLRELLSSLANVERILVKADGRMFFIRMAEIDWVEAYGNYVRVHVGSTAHLLRETMSSMERMLPQDRFARIHRSTIVNLDRVVEMKQWMSGDYNVLLTTGVRVKLSRSYRESLEQRARTRT
ncbi:MAG TPA: LytTR family DNA-binding domain-containing protein [Gemmatimonadaceae bacterium]|nr:LytTR family DNA-binding domain-containing protein [Gemmatimonadaceae bacterium]